MKALLSALLFACSALAQEPAPPPAAAPAPPPAAAAAPPPASDTAPPPPDNRLTGWVEAGYRWQSSVSGSEETYRSIVNLGSGLKLTALDLTFQDPKQMLFDNVHVQAYDWPDPYSTLRVDVAKKALYRFSASYRRLNYFNNLPSYADPLLSRGIVLNEQSFDNNRHLGTLDLQLLPSRRFSPYFGMESDAENGQGVDTFVSGGNEYPVPFSDTGRTRVFRGGVHFTLPRLHLTVEQGGVTSRENQETYSHGTNTGNANAPVFGQTLYLTGLSQAYGVRGDTIYSKANITAAPLPWLDVYGQFLFGQGQNTVNYNQYDTGNLLSLSQVLFYSGEQFLETAAAKMPHTTAEAGWEIRPMKRVRVRQSWGTDRLHNSGSGASADSFLGTNYSHIDSSVSFEADRHLTVRAGYSRVWGDATDFVLPAAGLTTQINSRLRRNVIDGGATWKGGDRALFTGSFEHGFSGGTYFRTSLYDYDKARLMARYLLMKGLTLRVDYTVLSNRNPLGGSPYYNLAHQESASVEWFPTGGKAALDVTYEHCGYHTRITYIDPTDFSTSLSSYSENCHTVVAALSTTLPGRISVKAGGSALLTSGSRPTSFFQPTLRLSAPLAHNLSWFAEWRYYGFGEAFYQYENFHAHLFSTGMRLSR